MEDNSIEAKVAKATPGELICMLYERAIRDLNGARELFELKGDPRSEGDAIRLVVHAQQIIAELDTALDKEKSGDLAANLSHIYEYIQWELTSTITERSPKYLAEVISLMTELLESWKACVANAAKFNAEKGL